MGLANTHHNARELGWIALRCGLDLSFLKFSIRAVNAPKMKPSSFGRTPPFWQGT